MVQDVSFTNRCAECDLFVIFRSLLPFSFSDVFSSKNLYEEKDILWGISCVLLCYMTSHFLTSVTICEPNWCLLFVELLLLQWYLKLLLLQWYLNNCITKHGRLSNYHHNSGYSSLGNCITIIHVAHSMFLKEQVDCSLFFSFYMHLALVSVTWF